MLRDTSYIQFVLRGTGSTLCLGTLVVLCAMGHWLYTVLWGTGCTLLRDTGCTQFVLGDTDCTLCLEALVVLG